MGLDSTGGTSARRKKLGGGEGLEPQNSFGEWHDSDVVMIWHPGETLLLLWLGGSEPLGAPASL